MWLNGKKIGEHLGGSQRGGARGLKPDDQPWEFVKQEFGYVAQTGEAYRPLRGQRHTFYTMFQPRGGYE